MSRLVRGLVTEKETKIREGLLMMGLSPASLLGSWVATYAIMFALSSAFITAFTATTIFAKSDKFFVWLIFFLFGLSSTTYSYLCVGRGAGGAAAWEGKLRLLSCTRSVSTLFNRAKTATILGVVLFFAGYMPAFAVGTNTATESAKLAGSLLSPTAFALVINLAGTYEDAGAGVQWSNLGDTTGNYSMSSGAVVGSFLYRMLRSPPRVFGSRGMNYC